MFFTVNGKADFVMCSIYVSQYRYTIIDYGVNYIQASSKFLVPRPKLEPFKWYSMFQSLQMNVWIVNGLLFLLTTTSLLFSRYLYQTIMKPQKRQNGTLMDIIFMLLGITYNCASIKRFQIPGYGFILTCWSVFGLFIGILYSCDLEGVLKFPNYDKVMNTPAEFLASDLSWTLLFEIDYAEVTYTEYTSLLVNKVDIIKPYQLNTLIDNLKNKRKAIFVITQDKFPVLEALPLNFLPKDVLLDLRLMKGNFLQGTVAPVYRKNSPYKRYFEKLLMQIIDAGIFEYIKDEEIRKLYSNAWNSVRFERQTTHAVTKLNLSQMYGTFLILCFGLGISGMVFIMELIIYKYKNARFLKVFFSIKISNI